MAWKRRETDEKRDVYQEVTDKIVAALERGGVPPWVRPWTARDAASGGGVMPINGSTLKPYRGVNVILLWASSFNDTRWYTFAQAHEAGGHVRKGEKGTLACFFKPSNGSYRAVQKDETTGEEKEVSVKKPPVLRHFYLWNHTQIDWDQVADPVEPAPAPAPEMRFKAAQELVERSGAQIRHGGDRAFYRPSEDRIQLPPVEVFVDEGAYWSTALHELTHWTGHPSRCKRAFGGRFGDAAYAFEELVAELGSAMLCALAEIDGKLQHQEYLANWLQVLKSDKYAIFTASREAQKAADFISRQADTADENEGAEGAEGAA